MKSRKRKAGTGMTLRAKRTESRLAERLSMGAGLLVWELSVFALLFFGLLLGMDAGRLRTGISLGSSLFLLCLLGLIRMATPEKAAGVIRPVLTGFALVLLFAVPGAAGAVLDDCCGLLCKVWPRIYPHFGNGSEAAALLGYVAAGAVLAGVCSLLLEQERKLPEWLFCGCCLTGLALCQKAFPLPGKLCFLAGCFLLAVHTAARKKGSESGTLFRAGGVQVLLPLFTLLLGAGVLYGLRGTGILENPAAVTAARSSLQKKLDSWRYGAPEEGMPGGDLSRWEALKLSGDTMLTVQLDTPEAYYLRGFVGDTYEDGAWKPLDGSTLCQYPELFYWLHREDFYGESQISGAARETLSEAPGEQQLSVQNVAADSRWLYLPYEVEAGDILPDQQIGDASVKAVGLHGQRAYSARISEPLVTRGAEMAAGLSGASKHYQNEEAHYNEYVYQTDLEIPDAVRTLLSENLGEVKLKEGECHADYGEAKQSILYFLTACCIYSEDAQSYIGDPLVWFIKDGRTGYSVQYASAAVMMFRYFGIPARYVEGYLVTPEDVENRASGEEISITGQNAHAWAEYYQDGIGWLPFEVTPAYLGVMPSPHSYESLSGSSGNLTTRENPEDTDQQEEQQQEEPDTRDYLLVLLIAVAVVLALILLTFVIWLIVGRIHARRRRKRFDDPDPVRGIDAMFRYLMQMLFLMGMPRKYADLEAYEREIRTALGDGLAGEFDRVWAIRRKGLFSGRGSTETERSTTKVFYRAAYTHVMKKATPAERFAFKFLYFM